MVSPAAPRMWGRVNIRERLSTFPAISSILSSLFEMELKVSYMLFDSLLFLRTKRNSASITAKSRAVEVDIIKRVC